MLMVEKGIFVRMMGEVLYSYICENIEVQFRLTADCTTVIYEKESSNQVSVISTSKIGGKNTKWMWMLLCIIMLCNFFLGYKLTVQDRKNTKLYYQEGSTLL